MSGHKQSSIIELCEGTIHIVPHLCLYLVQMVNKKIAVTKNAIRSTPPIATTTQTHTGSADFAGSSGVKLTACMNSCNTGDNIVLPCVSYF